MSKTPPKPQTDPNKPEPAKPEPVRVAGAKCVRCGQPMQAWFRPFCSQRCADIDLGQWASGAYRVPTGERPAEPEDEEG